MPSIKAKTVTLTALKNIPITLCSSSKDIPARLKTHPGGARVERGTRFTVSAEQGERLKKLKYAE